MRLDKFLKVSRLIKRRTVANEACDAEKVSVNGKPARASYDVKVGDEIEINMGKSPLKIRVLKVVEVVGKDADRFIIHHGFRLRTDRIAAVIAAAAVVAEHEQKMTLVRKQLRIKRFRAALEVGN